MQFLNFRNTRIHVHYIHPHVFTNGSKTLPNVTVRCFQVFELRNVIAVLQVQGDLALVGSTAAAPMLQIFSISSAGLHLLRVIMLSDGLPDLGSARLAGLALHSRLGSIGISCILARPVAGQQPAGEIFGGQRTFVLHSSQYVLGGCGEKPGNSAVGEGAGEGVIDVGGGLGGLRAEVSELALKVEGLRQHMDARFDRLEELIRRLQSGKG